MDSRDLSGAIVEALTPSRRQVVAFGLVFVWPWLIGLCRIGEMIGHLTVVLAVLVRKHWGW